MAEYIERQKVYEMLYAIGGCGAEPESWADGWDKAIDTAIEEIAEIPAADVRPERRGKWDDSLDGITPYCTICGMTHKCFIRTPKYCPNCGAKMDGKDGENNGQP